VHIKIAPSILAADFARLGEQVRQAENAGADRIHVDVMDGHFVPNLSMGPVVVRSLRPVTTLPLEVHLMIENPGPFINPFLDAGADTVIVHCEVVPEPRTLVDEVHARGKKIGLAVKPGTGIEKLERFIADIDLALCMTVEPGFGGQQFLPESPERIRRLRDLIERDHPACELEVDGGIEVHTAPLAIRAGANVLVAGTAVFRAPGGPAHSIPALLGAR
jgi:ribulose-phosphate 3-epimerase